MNDSFKLLETSAWKCFLFSGIKCSKIGAYFIQRLWLLLISIYKIKTKLDGKS